MKEPKRIQRKRTKGYKQPPNTKYVGRPTVYGNPFRVKGYFIEYWNINKKNWQVFEKLGGAIAKDEDVVRLYNDWLHGRFDHLGVFAKPPTFREIDNLEKHDYISCFCPLDKPCHTDVLIKLIHNSDTL
jgi:hypothetical protein